MIFYGAITIPPEIWRPSGAIPEMGTRYAVEHFLKAYNWDNLTRPATLPSTPRKIILREFDRKGENQIVYEKNGVKIKSWPAIHAA